MRRLSRICLCLLLATACSACSDCGDATSPDEGGGEETEEQTATSEDGSTDEDSETSEDTGAEERTAEVMPDTGPTAADREGSLGEATAREWFESADLPTPTDLPEGAERPRYSNDGAKLVFQAGEPGARTVWVATEDHPEPRALAALRGDNRHPTWDRNGRRVVYASDRKGDDYDLYIQSPDARSATRIADLEGDELHPTVNPLEFEWVAAMPPGEGGGMRTIVLEAYQKLAFTRRRGASDADEIWGMSVGMPEPEQKQVGEHGGHRHRLSEEGTSCRHPNWSGDGRSLVYDCDEAGDPVVADGELLWGNDTDTLMSFFDDLDSMYDLDRCDPDDDRADWRSDDCLSELPRKHVGLRKTTKSAPDDQFERPAVSANQTVLLADGPDGVVWRNRADGAEWESLEAPQAASDPVWAPNGELVAYTDPNGNGLGYTETDFYLQDVTNLNEFTELVSTRSERLDENGFVARPNDHGEFYEVYDKLRYRERPQFVTGDALLQVFRDQFVWFLEDAESEAEDKLREMSIALADHYWKQFRESDDAGDRYLAVHFATAGVPLRAAETIRENREKPGFGERHDAMIDVLPDQIPEALEAVPDPIRTDVEDRLDKMMAHKGTEKLEVPGVDAKVKIDFSQFKVRGSYAENQQGAYFLTMVWYSMVPLPLDATLVDLQSTMEELEVGGETAMARWEKVSEMVGAFMGKPADASLSHLAGVAEDEPEVWSSFEREQVVAELEERRGEVNIRDADSLWSVDRRVKVTFFPKRVGLDSTFFSQLTGPDLKWRPYPSALDAFAGFGHDLARKYALRGVEETEYEEAYRKALDKLRGEHVDGGEPLLPSDLYHSWLAALLAFAEPHDLPEASPLQFARTDAWQDRKLHSALAGYTQLKHASVLYSAQPTGFEGGGPSGYSVLVERPVVPAPRGFVDPEPDLFRRLADLADQTYSTLGDGDEPGIMGSNRIPGREEDGPLNAKTLAERAAEIAEQELDDEPLTPDDYEFIRRIGPMLEKVTEGSDQYASAGDTRSEYGLPVVVDVYTNAARRTALELGVGRLLDAYVAVPNDVGRRMSQGALFSFYEFREPMSDRLTDRQWNERLEEDGAPARPTWTDSFIEPVEGDWQ